MIIYHGSTNIIEKPVYGAGKKYNDYGQAFYCTHDMELAKEWACQNENIVGYANEYILDMAGLFVLDLTDSEYNILNWLAVLIENRTFSLKSDIAGTGFKYITDNFSVDYKQYDVILGYRADDSYFRFASAFLNNEISLQQLNKAMALGKLGVQIAIRSEKGFAQLKYSRSIMAETDVYYNKRTKRDELARSNYKELSKEMDIHGKYLVDIIREGWRDDDVCI